MSWMNELYKVYENHCGKLEYADPLLPVFHSTANAQIEVELSETGEFRGARRVGKDEMVTVIPVTEGSGSRSSGIAPHPYADKLIYIAGDYSKYVQGKKTDNKKFYNAYLQQLEKWHRFDLQETAVSAVYEYLKSGTLMEDLIASRTIFELDETGKLSEKAKINGINQEDSMVRFVILNATDIERKANTWQDRVLYDSYIDYYSHSMEGARQLCYATGEELPCTYKHPSKIRNAGDKAKLISSNDESGFSYRGRFQNKEQALSVSYLYSQKIHNALKWLVAQQGMIMNPKKFSAEDESTSKKQKFNIGSLSMVIWESQLNPIPSPMDDSEDILDDWIWDDSEAEETPGTNPLLKEQLQKAMLGVKKNFNPNSKVMIMTMDAATPGRLAITLYTELSGSKYLENVANWHLSTSWNHYDFKGKRRIYKSSSAFDIAECAFGVEQEGRLVCKEDIKRDTVNRLIPCIIEGKSVPNDIVINLVNRACKRTAYEKTYNWMRVLETACGLLKKTAMKEMEGEESMGLDEGNFRRDYLYGRLLSVAQWIESSTFAPDERHLTNAERYFEAFSNHPYRTWGIIYERLRPYMDRMESGKRIYCQRKIDEIMDCFDAEAFRNDSRLKPEFLMAYSCQNNVLYSKKNESEEN